MGAATESLVQKNARVLKGRIRGIYLRGEIYWFGKMVNGRRSIVSLETRDYAEAVERAREILERPELQPARALTAEVQRFLKHSGFNSVKTAFGTGNLKNCLTSSRIPRSERYIPHFWASKEEAR